MRVYSNPEFSEELEYHNEDNPDRDLIRTYLDSLPKALTEERQKKLFSLLQNWDNSVKNELIEWNLRFVVFIAKNFLHTNLPFVDLIQEWNIWLIEAVEKFNPYKWYKFTTYAKWWVRRYIIRFIQNNLRTVRISIPTQEFNNRINKIIRSEGISDTKEIAEKLNEDESTIIEYMTYMNQESISIDTPLSDSWNFCILDTLEDKTNIPIQETLELKNLVEKLFWNLSDRQIAVTKLIHLKDIPLREASKILWIWRWAVEKRKDSAIKKMQTYVRINHLKESDLSPYCHD